jgi:hypothetical protein
MANTDWIFPGTAESVAGSYNDWANPNNIKADDTSFSVVPSMADSVTDYLQGTNFGFGSYVPSGATIDGIELMVSRKASVANEIYMNGLFAVGLGGTPVDHSSATKWGTSESQVTLGSSTDIWTSVSVSRDDIIASGFGFKMTAYGVKSGTSTASVQYMKARIYYTASGGGKASKGTVGGTFLGTYLGMNLGQQRNHW